MAVGEFGRAPEPGRLTRSSDTRRTGRGHRPHAVTALPAGGVRGGQVYGATTADGGYARGRPVTPADPAATVPHRPGIDAARRHEGGPERPRPQLSDGRPITDPG